MPKLEGFVQSENEEENTSVHLMPPFYPLQNPREPTSPSQLRVDFSPKTGVSGDKHQGEQDRTGQSHQKGDNKN